MYIMSAVAADNEYLMIDERRIQAWMDETYHVTMYCK